MQPGGVLTIHTYAYHRYFLCVRIPGKFPNRNCLCSIMSLHWNLDWTRSGLRVKMGFKCLRVMQSHRVQSQLHRHTPDTSSGILRCLVMDGQFYWVNILLQMGSVLIYSSKAPGVPRTHAVVTDWQRWGRWCESMSSVRQCMLWGSRLLAVLQ